jgi:HECT-domain (ubiquitin-transferase)
MSDAFDSAWRLFGPAPLSSSVRHFLEELRTPRLFNCRQMSSMVWRKPLLRESERRSVQEHVLDVAKAVVRRTHLLSDATSTMQRFTEGDVCNRRLEVRFEGESGFDAASGSEAGVTRGFYADVAESLLSTENVASIYCSTPCAIRIALSPTEDRIDVDAKQPKQLELPLWIPDLDASGQVVIPTPRAATRSAPGVFPRPLPHYHPQMSQVLDRFRLMGRLFAAAIRDGFMFPLPLSSSFLKLVQRGGPLVSYNRDASKTASADLPFLTSSDLPRPGFLGGEVAAAEAFVCRALDSVDANDPPLSSLELERRYKEIALDRKFARVALGKLFDCSFEDYFQDRTFVDPLDPTQGEDAVPLCPGGHRKHVTIYNVREWVSLCKKFMLHDGVMAQAEAFRLGIEDFFAVTYLRLFTPEELQRDICGVGDNVDHWDEASVRKLFKLDGTFMCDCRRQMVGVRVYSDQALHVFACVS